MLFHFFDCTIIVALRHKKRGAAYSSASLHSCFCVKVVETLFGQRDQQFRIIVTKLVHIKAISSVHERKTEPYSVKGIRILQHAEDFPGRIAVFFRYTAGQQLSCVFVIDAMHLNREIHNRALATFLSIEFGADLAMPILYVAGLSTGVMIHGCIAQLGHFVIGKVFMQSDNNTEEQYPQRMHDIVVVDIVTNLFIQPNTFIAPSVIPVDNRFQILLDVNAVDVQQRKRGFACRNKPSPHSSR